MLNTESQSFEEDQSFQPLSPPSPPSQLQTQSTQIPWDSSENLISPSSQQPSLSSIREKISVYIEKLLNEPNQEFLERNLKLMEKMEFTDSFSVKETSTKLHKQPDFLPSYRRLKRDPFRHLDLECINAKRPLPDSKGLNEGIINVFLETLCKNFSHDDFDVTSSDVLTAQQVISTGDLSLFPKSSAIHFAPMSQSNFWSVVIITQARKIIFTREYTIEGAEKETMNCAESWKSGYSVLIRCLQELTKNHDEHSDQLIKDFRCFLREMFKDNDSAYQHCMRCFIWMVDESECSTCCLNLCKRCLVNGKCNRCLL